MRGLSMFVSTSLLLLAVPSAGAVYIEATWGTDEVDLDDTPVRSVEARVHLATQCFTLINYPAAVALAAAAPGVLFFYNGKEIQQLDLMEFEWELSHLPVPHLYVDETFQVEVRRDPNVTGPIDTQQRWLHWGISHTYDSCPFFESITIQPIIHGESVREYIHFSASGLNGTAGPDNGGPNIVDEAAFPKVAPLFIVSAAAAIALRRHV